MGNISRQRGYQLVLSLSVEDLKAVCTEIILNKAFNVQDLANLLSITQSDAIMLLSSPEFLSMLGNMRKAMKSYEFVTTSLDALSDIVENPLSTDDSKIKAINAQANILGFNSQNINVNANLSIESLLDRLSKNVKIENIETLPGLD